MTVTRNTIIAEILQNDPSQGCVPIFLNTGMHCLAAWLPMVKPWSRPAWSTVWTPTNCAPN